MQATATPEVHPPQSPLKVLGPGFRLIDLVDEMLGGKDVFFRFVRVASDVMTRDPKVLTLDDTVQTCLKLMTESKIRHVPVVDPPTEKGAEPTFIGVVSGRDISRHLSPYVGKVGQEETDSKHLRDHLVQLVTRKPKSIAPDTRMPELLKVMIENHVDMVPVLAGNDLVGLVTTSDILGLFVRIHKIRRCCTQDQPAAKKVQLLHLRSKSMKMEDLFQSCFQTVDDMMTSQPVCLDEADSIAKAMELMQKGSFRHLPVVNPKRQLVGIVSDRNILRYLPGPCRKRARPEAGFRADLFEVDGNDSCLRVPATHIMTLDVVHVTGGCDIYTAAVMMHDSRVSSLVVTDSARIVRGIVTVTDFMRALLTAYEFAGQQDPKEADQSGSAMC